jgi:flagellar motor switch protein FliG
MNTTTKRDTPASRAAARNARNAGGITPSQRAAVIIALLGEDAAKPIVEKLDDAALAKVVSALEHISVLAREELVEIVIDFLTQLRQNAGSMRGGRERAREVLSGVVDQNRLNLLFGGPAPDAGQGGADQGGDVWSRLRQREPRQIAEYLGRLSPNIIALILRRLDAGVSSNVLCMLPDEKVSPTLGHMVESAKIDPGVDSVIERMIEMEFLNNQDVAVQSDDSHLETIGEVLSLIPDQKRDNLVSFLRAQHETKLPIIQKGLFTIESLPEILPRNAVPVVMREVDNAVIIKLIKSLGEGSSAVSEYLLGNISSRLAEQMREEVKAAPALSQEQAEAVQREFLTLLMDMKRRGLITIVRPADKPE